MIAGLAHSSFTISDLEQSLKFYKDLLGFELEFLVERSGPITEAIVGVPGAKIKIAMLKLNNFRLELIQYLSPVGEKLDLKANNIGCAHIAFYVKDLDDVYNTLLAKGINFRSKPAQIKDGPSAGWKIVYMVDPDGIILELMQEFQDRSL